MSGRTRQRRVIAFTLPAFAGLLALLFSMTTVPASAAAALTVAQAISSQSGTGTVVGYVVGEPTATSTVRFSNFTGDTALAIADSASETSTSKMLYVQITSTYRSSFGLLTNPSLIGKALTVTGTLTAYFTHAGLKSPTAMTLGATATTSPTATATASPTVSSTADAYYAAAIGKSGTSLKNALHTIISSNVTTLSYDAVWNALKVTDQDPANSSNVILLYSGTSRSKTLNGGSTGNWNREHVWAQSHGDFGTANGPGTDLHHLRPEDVTINAVRGNKDFDDGGTAVSGASGNYTDSDSWEPRDAVKGDVARMLFYMAVRYQGDDAWPDLEVNNAVNNGSNPYMGKLSTLVQWNAEDPPSTAEKTRNQVIYSSYQRNRNPFIDHPEWVSSIFG
ncbi:endonuclease I [Actinoplanes lutulentus]|uniref:Endonuclease I n=1 Tax=Actinoplanes lutulentus TaxID=1287878 RepID=A0A327Z0P3_9ACTN|nr:endonuclease [Actinoplanes lutulentus]MBB2947697.1 endonuclease I [Actinoplanes lutulentus]RAK27752.1 endonuclease I [Actinoplanes lutulentus]